MATEYKTLGSARVKKEWNEQVCQRCARWFNKQGEWVSDYPLNDTRQRLWYCLDLLSNGDPKYQALAQQVILKTPVDHNHFEPFAAVELLLRFPDKLTPKAAAWLRHICEEHYINALEFRMGGGAAHNFTSMTTWFLLAASQVLNGYKWEHPLASIPEVYTQERMRAIGLNALAALCYWGEHQPVLLEWNSPTYTPISAWSMAKIVELVDDPQAKAMALEMELDIWRQILAMYHPHLGVSCGPYARAYRQDMLGGGSQMRGLLSYVGISPDRSVVRLLEDAVAPNVRPDPDTAFRYSGFSWEMSNKYHVPVAALEELKNRKYPYRFSAPISWDSFGYVNPKTHLYVPVQGGLLPGGTAEIVQVQQPTWALGWRTAATMGHSFPIHLQYGLRPQLKGLRDLRSVVAAVAFHNAPPEWMEDWRGAQIEVPNFNNEADVRVTEAKKGLSFTARPFPGMAGIASDELSVNSFIPVHFAEVDEITLDGEKFTGEPLSKQAKQAVLRVKDAGMVYEIEYVFPRPVEMKVYRWGNFVRFAGFWYRGKKQFFKPEELKKLSASGRLTVIKAPKK